MPTELVIPNGFAVLRFVFTLAGDSDDMMFTLGVQASAAPGPTALSAIYDAYADNFLIATASEFGFRGISISGKTDGGVEYNEELYSTAYGTGGGPCAPQNTAVLMQKRTGLAGRRNRGRSYLVGLAQEGEITSAGVISNTYLGSLQTKANQFFTDLNVGAATDLADVVILHSHEVGGPAAPAPTPVTAFVIDDRVATQRRRLR